MERRRRMRYLAWAIVVLGLVFAGQGVTADRAATGGTVAEGAYPGNTLISVQSYKLDGRLIEVTPEGETVWEFDPPDSRVFDAEQLENGNVLVGFTRMLDPANCPDEQLIIEPGHCVKSSVVELDYETKEPVWRYTWKDEYITHHEVHDVDRLEDGTTAVVDMGNDRAFVVNESGNVTWEWHAENHLAEGTEFYEEHGGHPDPGNEADWTHVNDIDELENGNFQLSVRNFDVVLEVDRETKEIVGVVGEPGNHDLLYEQHNPHRLQSGTLLVADSENDRVVEINRTTEEIVWQYGGDGLLHWPRDADRLPNGNTLVVDTFNDRVLEINPEGEVVWSYEGVRMPYSADRLSVPEEDHATVPGTELDGSRSDSGLVVSLLQTAEAYASFVFPAWIDLPELLTLAGIVLAGVAFVVDGAVVVVVGRGD